MFFVNVVLSLTMWEMIFVQRLFIKSSCLPGSPGSSVHGILQARILEWVAISSLMVVTQIPQAGGPYLHGGSTFLLSET